jgi:hypothetical protein
LRESYIPTEVKPKLYDRLMKGPVVTIPPDCTPFIGFCPACGWTCYDGRRYLESLNDSIGIDVAKKLCYSVWRSPLLDRDRLYRIETALLNKSYAAEIAKKEGISRQFVSLYVAKYLWHLRGWQKPNKEVAPKGKCIACSATLPKQAHKYCRACRRPIYLAQLRDRAIARYHKDHPEATYRKMRRNTCKSQSS